MRKSLRNKQKLTNMLLNLLENYSSNKIILVEQTVKLAKNNFLQKGKISQEDFDRIVASDPSRTKKYVYWMCKQYSDPNQTIQLHDLINAITEFDTLVRSGRFAFSVDDLEALSNDAAYRKRIAQERKKRGGTRGERLNNVLQQIGAERPSDIYSYKTFADLQTAVDALNHTVQGINAEEQEKQKKQDELRSKAHEYWICCDNKDLFMVEPKTREAAQSWGAKAFHFPGIQTKFDGAKCGWCVTFDASQHFNSYYYGDERNTFYMTLAKEGGNFRKELFAAGLKTCVGIAVQVTKRTNITYWDVNDKPLSGKELNDYRGILNKYMAKARAAGQLNLEPEEVKTTKKTKTVKK